MVNVVAHPQTGLVITPSTNNPEYGTFRVDSKHVSLENGFVNIQKRSAFVRGRVTDLESLSLTPNKALPGQILRKESFEPFYEGQEAKINPTTQEVVLTNGVPTYLEFVYTVDMKATDTWVGVTPEGILAETQDGQDDQTI